MKVKSYYWDYINNEDYLNNWMTETEAEVNAEIERQALSDKGTTFVKLKVENFVACGGVQWS